MHFIGILLAVAGCVAASTPSTDGILNLVKRRLPDHVDHFEFRLVGNITKLPVVATPPNDEYTISSTRDGKILVEGNSPIALASG